MSSRMKGYPLSSLSRMLYRGWWRLMREFSKIRASNSDETKMVSKWSTCDTMALVFSLWEAVS